MSDYYSLEKAAEVLGKTPGELNRLREGGKIRAFRDGSAWKFRKEDIDNFLTDEIRQRGSSPSFEDDGLLTDDSDEEEKPTMMAADTSSFKDLNLEITSNSENGVSLDGDDSDGIILGNGSDDSRAGSSSIDLNDDFDDDDDFASGISILDDPSDLSGSNIDLASDSGVSIDDSGMLGEVPSTDSGSGSGISILDEDDSAPKAAPASGGDDFDFELDPLPEDGAPAPAPEPAPAAPSADDVFDLQPQEEPSANLNTGTGETYGVAGEASTAHSQDLDLDNDFELEATPENQESESESSSQMLDLELDDLGLSPPGGADADAGSGINLEKTPAGGGGGLDGAPAPGDAAEGGFDLGDTSMGDAFGQGGDAFSEGGFGGEDPFAGGFDNGGFGGEGDLGTPDFTPSAGGDGDFAGAGVGFDGAPAAEGEDQQVIQGKPIDFNGLGIGLGLVPCILLLLLAGIGAWELVRSMWSWEQPFSLTGPVLEMIGNLLKLWK
ncbi:MAG: helix-turn-helix domain-containing protein [Thermoguttaceae bacterium]|nr:helix-turn-helix domain-containing protein [Thermoguttaceae bacterium]